VDKNIWERYHLAELIPLDQFDVTIIEAVESNKTIYKVIDVWKRWEDAGVTKKYKVVVIGGGILQDIGAFASSAYLRNIEWYFFPTTLLAQCDSCIGSKCGINLNMFKNQIGTFYAPKRIFIDTHFLDTLTETDLYSGMGEIFKASLTSDKLFFYDFREMVIDRKDRDNLEGLIYRSLMVKKTIVEADEFEKDYRRVLNYGHTFAHALEAYSNNEIPHGAAVTLGVDIANYIARKKGLLNENEYRKVQEVACLLYRFPFPHDIDIERLYYFMRKDKKSEGNSINFIIPSQLGKLQIYPMQLDANLAKLLESYFSDSYAVYRH
jgi:3-dehydroquinate synthase